jgi:hypothetical protein
MVADPTSIGQASERRNGKQGGQRGQKSAPTWTGLETASKGCTNAGVSMSMDVSSAVTAVLKTTPVNGFPWVHR